MAAPDQFVEVKRKKKRSKTPKARINEKVHRLCDSMNNSDSLVIEISRIIRRIKYIRGEVWVKELFKKVIEDVQTWLISQQSTIASGRIAKNGFDDQWGEDDVRNRPEECDNETSESRENCTSWNVDIVCYGLGAVSSCPLAREQTALLMELKGRQDVQSTCYCYDPYFNQHDCDILRELGCELLDKNEEGKRTISRPTIFFMPHCGKALYNNLLWANWEINQLSKVFIIGNSFLAMNERLPKRIFEKDYEFIHKILPLIVEQPFPLNRESETAFSDTSCHWIFSSKLSPQPSDFWTRKEPTYPMDNVEIILGKHPSR